MIFYINFNINFYVNFHINAFVSIFHINLLVSIFHINLFLSISLYQFHFIDFILSISFYQFHICISRIKKLSKYSPVHKCCPITSFYYMHCNYQNFDPSLLPKKTGILKTVNSQKNWRRFQGLVLGLVGLIDAKGINVTQLIWPSGCPT